ncbi:hypothetical protein Tco_1363152 [Tanacetum coccineum]
MVRVMGFMRMYSLDDVVTDVVKKPFIQHMLAENSRFSCSYLSHLTSGTIIIKFAHLYMFVLLSLLISSSEFLIKLIEFRNDLQLEKEAANLYTLNIFYDVQEKLLASITVGYP